MLHITIIGVGKIKERYFTDAIEEYRKRLTRYCKISIEEVPDEAIPENPSPAQMKKILEKEGIGILSKIPEKAQVIALCIEGKQMPSEELAEFLADRADGGDNNLVFVIGGSLGLADEVKTRAALRLSFSPMTFPHQLMRVLLSEQIYRAFTILHNGKYHK